jgi:hypothetical protein
MGAVVMVVWCGLELLFLPPLYGLEYGEHLEGEQFRHYLELDLRVFLNPWLRDFRAVSAGFLRGALGVVNLHISIGIEYQEVGREVSVVSKAELDALELEVLNLTSAASTLLRSPG